jgi:flagellar basal-body rod protein FlgG
MTVSMYDAAAGALIQQIRLDILANNLSNINTVGFKEDKAVFQTFLPDTLGTPTGQPAEEGASENEEQVLSPFPEDYAVNFEGAATNFTAGRLKHTGNPLDFALQGNGFFCIQTDEGTQYTRKGSFTINDEGLLSTQDGLPVLGTGGSIRLTEANFSVDSAGGIYTVDAEGGMYVDETVIAQIKVVDFDEPYPLKKEGDTRFSLGGPGIEEKEALDYEIRQGYVEDSNVDPMRTMTEMIEVLRHFEAYQKVIQAVDDINEKATEELAQIA